jgi:hypothetical protein
MPLLHDQRTSELSMRSARLVLCLVAQLCLSVGVHGAPARAQGAEGEWGPGVQTTPAPPEPGNTTIVPRTGGEEPGSPTDGLPVRLVALLTSDGQNIDQGLIWRIFESGGQTEGKTALIRTFHDASPVLKAKPGDYFVNVAFGRAHLTRRITVKPGPGEPAVEQFVINAGGLRVSAVVSGHEAPANSVAYSIYSDRDQSDNRKVVLNSAKPGLVIRLNAGIYHIISTYGDVNSKVASDVTVEAGKLTEVTLTHSAAKATFKLVHRAGGEALPDTQWSIQTQQGDEIKQSAGALPTHILAPGTYTVIAKSQGKVFEREFTLSDGDTSQVEVLIK